MQGAPALAQDAVPTGGGISGLRLTVDVPSTTTGVTSVRFGDVPPSEIPERTAPTETAPIGKSPIGKSPIGKSPIGKSPILDTSLAAFPLLREGGWTTILAHTCTFSNRDRTTCPKVVANEVATATPQSVTWAQLLADPFARDGDPTTLPELDPGSPEALRLDEIIWALSPMRDVSFLSLLMGVTSWEGVAPPEGGWCAEWIALGKSCSAGDLRRTIFEAESDGLPLERTSLPDTPFGAVADPAGTLFWSTTIIDTNIAGSSLGDIPFGAIANLSRTVDCSGGYCSVPTTPLRRAAEDGRILDTGTFADLGMSALGSLSLAAIEYAFLDPAALDWEGIPLEDVTFERLPPPATTFVRYTLSYSVGCVDADGMRATVDLPDGFRYRPGSSRFDTDPLIPGDAAVPDPVRSPPGDREGPLEWDLAAFACDGSSRTLALSFEAMPGFDAGTFASSATVETTTASAAVNDAAPVTVAGGLSTTSIAQPHPVATGSLVVGHIEDVGDRAYVEFTIDPAGAPSPTDDITVTLSHLERNYDLVVYAPDGSDTERSLRSTPPEPVPFGKGPAADPAHEATFDLRPEALQDVPIEPSKVVAGVSALPGTEMESLTVPAVTGADGSTTYTVQVSGNNGAHGPNPFVLTIRSSGRQTLPPCEPRTFPFAPVLPPDPLDPILGDVGNDGPPIVGSGIDSLILVHSRRLAAVFGPVEAARILSELADLEEAAPTLGFNAQVVDLALFRPVELAYAAADADPCSTDLANDVVRAINDAVDGLATPLNENLADLRWITLVGDDDLIPHARLRDGTTIGNERGFAGDTFFADPTTGEARSNQYSAAFASGHYLSDAPYGSFRPVSIFGQTIYPMQVAVGRLGGSASTITNAIHLFVASGGVADPETATPRPALVGDYDFATDGGDRIEAALAADGLSARRLRGAWTREALTEALFGGAEVPDVIAVNAHYDQHRLLPGAGDAGTWTDEDLFTTADVAAAASDSFELRILFGIGCHFGLAFPDRLAGSTPSATDAARVLDWQQAYVDKGAAALIANLGYGYGDTSAVGYSEQLMASLADNLADSPSIGEALTLSERDYLLSMGSFSAYDVKTVQQAILWGLPMYRLSNEPLGPAPDAASPDAHGLTDAGPFDTITVDLTPTFENVLAPGGHVYRRVTGNDVSCSTSSCAAEPDEGVQVTHPYPIVPRSVVRLPSTD
ncbi:MAG TPA: C25 family cysteine peptidase, partial [Actinomycetota bacterium]|nr:C25 family cysteine peptidase [Actinomycetota bacterium]